MTGEGQLREFMDDLGPAQMVGRQALGSRSLGDIQLSLNNVKGCLQVEVIRAKELKPKQGSKVIPGKWPSIKSPRALESQSVLSLRDNAIDAIDAISCVVETKIFSLFARFLRRFSFQLLT